MWRRIIIGVLGFFSLIHSAFAHTGDLCGFVFNLDDGTPIEGALVAWLSEGKSVQTDINGYYSLCKIPAGKWDVKVVLQGYDSLIKSIQIAADCAPTPNFNSLVYI